MTTATLLPVGAPRLPPASGPLRGRHAVAPEGSRKEGRRRWPVRWLSRALLAAALALMLATMGMALLGFRFVVISSGSMTPELRVGDLVVSRSARPAQTPPGDVVTFRDPDLSGQLVTHRVVSRTFTPQGTVDFTTRGDANSVSEHWSIGSGHSIGLVTGHLRAAGWWFMLLHTPIGRVACILLACLWIGVESLLIIWPRS